MKIMVSACLLGDNVKYDGSNNKNIKLIEFLKEYEVIKVCPECLGNLLVPRIPAEIVNDKVVNKMGVDVTESYILGAKKTLEIAKKNGVKIAILKKNSPSCGSGTVYDGTFTYTLIDGDGITAKILKENGVLVLNEENFEKYFKKD